MLLNDNAYLVKRFISFVQYVYGFPPLQALVLCYFLETNSKQYNLVDKNVIEIGAGTGLVSIVASLLGEYMPLLLCSWKHLSDEYWRTKEVVQFI